MAGKDPSYVPPKLNTAKRFSEMQAGAAKAAATPAPPAQTSADSESDARIKKSIADMSKLSVDALIRRAEGR